MIITAPTIQPLWLPPRKVVTPWGMRMASLKKGSSGHILKHSGGHLTKSCLAQGPGPEPDFVTGDGTCAACLNPTEYVPMQIDATFAGIVACTCSVQSMPIVDYPPTGVRWVRMTSDHNGTYTMAQLLPGARPEGLNPQTGFCSPDGNCIYFYYAPRVVTIDVYSNSECTTLDDSLSVDLLIMVLYHPQSPAPKYTWTCQMSALLPNVSAAGSGLFRWRSDVPDPAETLANCNALNGAVGTSNTVCGSGNSLVCQPGPATRPVGDSGTVSIVFVNA